MRDFSIDLDNITFQPAGRFGSARVHQYQYGETDRCDGASHKADAMFGVNTPDKRGNVTGCSSHTRRDEVPKYNRAFSATPLLADAQGRFQPFGSGNIPGG